MKVFKSGFWDLLPLVAFFVIYGTGSLWVAGVSAVLWTGIVAMRLLFK